MMGRPTFGTRDIGMNCAKSGGSGKCMAAEFALGTRSLWICEPYWGIVFVGRCSFVIGGTIGRWTLIWTRRWYPWLGNTLAPFCPTLWGDTSAIGGPCALRRPYAPASHSWGFSTISLHIAWQRLHIWCLDEVAGAQLYNGWRHPKDHWQYLLQLYSDSKTLLAFAALHGARLLLGRQDGRRHHSTTRPMTHQ